MSTAEPVTFTPPMSKTRAGVWLISLACILLAVGFFGGNVRRVLGQCLG